MSHSPAQNPYLVTDVMTAPAQKLQLLLIEGAIRFTQRARQLWNNPDFGPASAACERATQIMSELIGALRPRDDAALTEQVGGVYVFVINALTQAQTTRQVQHLDDVLRVLEIERGTWQQVCRQLGTQVIRSANHDGAAAGGETLGGFDIQG